MPDAMQTLFLNFTLSLETFFNGAYFSRLKLILLRKFSKERFRLACFFLMTLFQAAAKSSIIKFSWTKLVQYLTYYLKVK